MCKKIAQFYSKCNFIKKTIGQEYITDKSDIVFALNFLHHITTNFFSNKFKNGIELKNQQTQYTITLLDFQCQIPSTCTSYRYATPELNRSYNILN